MKKNEKKFKELLDTVADKNKKISELENVNTRLKLMKEQSKEIIEKRKPGDVNDKKDSIEKKKKSKTKCRYENTGVCRNKAECLDVHPKKTCQAYSKLGSCPSESSCEHRHPFGVCFEWERHGACNSGEDCRHRHPFELSRSTPSYNHEPFLGHASPRRDPGGAGGEREGWGGPVSHWSPSQVRHHDLRGMGRW